MPISDNPIQREEDKETAHCETPSLAKPGFVEPQISPFWKSKCGQIVLIPLFLAAQIPCFLISWAASKARCWSAGILTPAL